jgi:hypothetical protein
MADDFLWKHIKLLADYFGGDVTSSSSYCAGTRCYDWETGKTGDCDPGQYEQILSEFLLHDPAGASKAGLDILVLIGGIGTGKSTAVRELARRVTEKPRICSALSATAGTCRESPIIITFDTGEMFGDPVRRGSQKERIQAQLNEFWNMAASRLEKIIGNIYSFDQEVSFWAWALDQSGIRDRSTVLHRWLNDCEYNIRASVTKVPYAGWSLDDILHSLERQRSDLLNRIPERDLVWYRVFQLIYAVREMGHFSCNCRYILLDNVDQLEPEVQRILVDFVILLSDVLRARTLISIRPLTWERSVHAHMLVRTENHYSASIRAVLTERWQRMSVDKRCPREAAAYVRELIRELTAPGSLWGDMYEATSGLSIRFAVRNFLNFAQSKLLPSLSEYVDPFGKLKASEVARAFFFGDGDALLHNNLENLYGLGSDMRAEYRLIKPRILDYLIRICEGGTTLPDLGVTMGRFGYSNQVIAKAVNDLLLRSRPLLWSQDGHQVSTLVGNAKVSVTPIGRGYYEKLFGQLYYDEICIARSAREVVPIDRVIDFHKQLWEQDKQEISYAIRKHGSGFYLRIYPRDKPAISAIHAANLGEGVERRAIALPPAYDAGRVEFIASEVEKLFGARW